MLAGSGESCFEVLAAMQVMVVGHDFKKPSSRQNVAKVPSAHKQAAPQPGSNERIAIPGFRELKPGEDCRPACLLSSIGTSQCLGR